MPKNDMTKCGCVALLGASNVGKSTLLNLMVGAKVSIVSPKVQTTRSRIRGIVVEEASEIILIDVPGVFKPKRRLDRAMVSAAWSEAKDADERLLVVDAVKGLDDDTLHILKHLNDRKQTAILAINKIDLIEKDKLLPLIEKFRPFDVISDTFCISAKNGEGVKDLMKFLADKIPEGPFMFPEDNLSDLPNRLFAAEITREKIFLNLQQELPYASAVETTVWENTDKDIRVHQNIFVERSGQKAIVIGKGGKMLKKIGSAARFELEKAFEKPVHLFLFVKVKENWTDDPDRYQEWGLDFNA